MRVTEITTAKITRYIERRMKQGLSNASINRELAALKRMFNLAARCSPPKVAQIPFIAMLKENNTRKGFFEHEHFLALMEHLPEQVKPVITFAYHTGWRRSEILDLRWNQVDLKEGTVRLEPGDTKNDEGRTIYMEPDLLDMMRELHGKRRLGCPHIFHRDGEKIKDFRDAWNRACTSADIPGMLFHDFRRTAVRNMVRAGIPEKVAMTISGHKTRAVFDRSNIVSREDLQEAARKRQAYKEQQDERLQNGDNRPVSGKKVISLGTPTN